MNGLKLYFLCNRVAMLSLHRQISTSAVMMTKPRRLRAKFMNSLRARYPNEDHDEEDYFDDQEDNLHPEADFSKLDQSYEDHFRELKYERSRKSRIITYKKFFDHEKDPLMLTNNEMSCIKYLHKQDPVQWNVETLSESFPALPETINKILKKKYSISPERMKVRDAKVQKNWQLLAEGKLDARPEVLEHLKKFTNHREVLLEQIKNSKFYLPEIKEEKVWNNGEMSSILSSYEQSVNKLLKSAQSSNKLLGDGSESDSKEKSSLDVLEEQINKEKPYKYKEGTDGFILGERVNYQSKKMTLQNLEWEILKKADSKRYLHLTEKAILESKLGKIKENPVVNKEVEMESSEVKSLPYDEQSSSNVNQYSSPRSRKLKFKNVIRNETTVEVEPVDDEEYHYEDDYDRPVDPHTLTMTEGSIGKFLELENAKQPGIIKEKPVVVEKKVEKVEKIQEHDPERMEREKLWYDKEENDIKETAFWNSKLSNQEKALRESKKAPLQTPKDVDKVTLAHVSSLDVYPERIKIPKDKRRSGLTFKVNDCYYDDDGEFLYRVPGMSN